MFQQKQYATQIYNLPFSGYHQPEIPVDLQNALNPLIKKLEKFDINLCCVDYLNGLLYYYIKGLNNHTPEDRQIADYILRLMKLRANNINFVEVIK